VWENKVCEDDKYYDTEELEDDFLKFYLYTYAHLNLPRPTFAQMYMAYFIAYDHSKYRMVMALRGLAKSLTAQVYTVWRLFRDPNEHILVMSVSATRAEYFTGFCKKIIKALPVTSNMTPRHNEERTSGSAFDVVGAEPSDSPSVYAVGVGNPIAGFRATLLIYDDIESVQSAASAVLTEKIDTNASEAHNLLIAGRDEVITLCTPHSMSSVYVEWLNRGHKALIIPAEYPEDIQVYGGFLAPYIVSRLKNNKNLVGTNVDERFPKELLEERKLVTGKSKYKLQYMLDTTASDDLRHPLKLKDLIVVDVDIEDFPERITYSSMPDNTAYIKHNGFKNDRLYYPSYISSDRTNYEYKIMAIDPAGSGSDETGFAVIFSSRGRLVIHKIGGITGGYNEESIVQLLQIAYASKVDTLVLEKNFGDGIYSRLIETIMYKQGKRLLIEDIRHSTSKEDRIIDTLEPLLNQRKIYIDKGTLELDHKSDIIYSLTYQLSHIKKEKNALRHDDRLDALAMGCKYLMDSLIYADPEDKEETPEELWDKLCEIKKNMSRNKIKINYGSRY
jgi:hypothetical protein